MFIGFNPLLIALQVTFFLISSNFYAFADDCKYDLKSPNGTLYSHTLNDSLVHCLNYNSSTGLLFFKKLNLDNARLVINISNNVQNSNPYRILNDSLPANTVLFVEKASFVSFQLLLSTNGSADLDIGYNFAGSYFTLDDSIDSFVVPKRLLLNNTQIFSFNLLKKVNVNHFVSASCEGTKTGQITASGLDLNAVDSLNLNEVEVNVKNLSYGSLENDIICFFEIFDQACSGYLNGAQLSKDTKSVALTTKIAVSQGLLNLNCRWIIRFDQNVGLIFNETELYTDSDRYVINVGKKSSSPILSVLYKNNLKSAILDQRLSVTSSPDLIVTYHGRNLGKASTIYAVASKNYMNFTDQAKFSSNPADLPWIAPKYLFQASGAQAVLSLKKPKSLKGTLRIYNKFFESSDNLLATFDSEHELPAFIGSDTTQLLLISDGKDDMEGEFSSSPRIRHVIAQGDSDSFVLDNSKFKLSCKDSVQFFIPSFINKIVTLTTSKLVLGPGDTFTVKNGTGVGGFAVTGTDTTTEVVLPQLVLNGNISHMLTYSKGDKNCNISSEHLLEVSFVASNSIHDQLSLNLTSNQEYVITSDNYPNNFSLTETEVHVYREVVSNKFIYWQLQDLDLALDQVVSVISESECFDKTIPADEHGDRMTKGNTFMFFNRTYNREFSSKDKMTGSGFKFVVKPVECGAEIGVSENKFILNPPNVTSDCVYIVNPQKRRSVNQFVNFTMSSYPKNVEIYDSNSMRGNEKLDLTLVNNTLLSSTSSIIVYWKYYKNQNPITLSWQLEDCKTLCQNNRHCMLEHWRCNNKNECGDNSDELHCNGTINNVPIVYTGINGFVCVFVIIPLAAIVGAILAIFGPRVLRRMSGDRYQEFQNLDSN